VQNNPLITFRDKILSNEYDFESTALEIFQFQYINNPIYRKYIDSLDT